MGTVLPVTEGLGKLPERPPRLPEMQFSSQQKGWPPMPREWQNVRAIHVEPLPGSLNDDLERQIRDAALRDPRVQDALGDRFAHIATDPLHIGKGRKTHCTEPFGSRLTFFSHARNVAIEVTMKGSIVQTVADRHGYQPREGRDEITDAICLARTDQRLKGHVELLSAHAILLPTLAEDVGCGHRILLVTFTGCEETEDEKPALFSATVNLITKTVLMARAEARENAAQIPNGGTHHAK